MRLIAKSPHCAGKDCPAVYETEAGSLLIQGTVVPANDPITLGEGEALVELPADLVVQLKQALG